jgi:plasmid stability protein
MSARKPTSPTLTIRRLPPHVVPALKERARRSGRSLEAEVRAILEAAVSPPVDELIARMRALREKIGGRIDAVQLLREARAEHDEKFDRVLGLKPEDVDPVEGAE